MTHGTTDLTADVPLDEIRALVDERGRYESWLATLESRRGATPEHVYLRVHEDYGGRLQGVLLALASHVTPLRGAEGALTRREEELTSTLGERHDELAEAELRTAVGEYTPEEGDRLRREKEEDVGRLDQTLQDVREELGQVRELLGRAQTDLTAGRAGLPGQTGAGTEAVGADESELPPAPAGDEPPSHPPGMMRPTPSIGSFLIEEQAAQGRSGAAAGGTAGTGSPSFEDLSLMTSGSATAGTTPGAGAAGGSRGFETPSSSSAGEGNRPFAPVAGELASPAAKTLRCQECGTMNFPTEWYCERCGGELAAL